MKIISILNNFSYKNYNKYDNVTLQQTQHKQCHIAVLVCELLVFLQQREMWRTDLGAHS